MKRILYYVSSHGFGHAARAGRVIKRLVADHGAAVTVRTAAPEWLFASLGLGSALAVEPLDADPGLIQQDSLSIDIPATLASLRARMASMGDDAAAELKQIERIRPDVVVADIAPLGVLAGAMAGLPTVVVANFLWDWILDDYAAGIPAMGDISAGMREIYLRATRILRTPLSGGMDGYPQLADIPLIARKLEKTKEAARRELGLDDSPKALVSLGGFGLERFTRGVSGRVRTADILISSDHTRQDGRIRHLDRRRFDYYDLFAACDMVIGKMGYSLCSELIANKRGFIYSPRSGFIEYGVLRDGTVRHVASLELEEDEFLNGPLDGHIQKLMAMPHPPGVPPMDQGETAAEAIMKLG